MDPGIGFGKTLEHNLLLMANLDKLVASGYRVLVGPSCKRFLGTITGRENAADRVFGTAATVALCAAADSASPATRSNSWVTTPQASGFSK